MYFNLFSAGSGVSPHPELPQGQMDSLLSIISSQRERFRSRNQELEAVSHDLSRILNFCLFQEELISRLSVSFVPPAGESLHAADHAGSAE